MQKDLVSKRKINLTDVFLIVLMIISISIFVIVEIKNNGKIDDSFVQQETQMSEDVIMSNGDYDKGLEELFKYYNYDFKKELFEKYFVRNIGEKIKYKTESFGCGIVSVDNKGQKIYEYPSHDIYPTVQVSDVATYDTYKGVTLEAGKKCLKVTVKMENTSDEAMYYSMDNIVVGITRDNYSYEEFAGDEPIRELTEEEMQNYSYQQFMDLSTHYVEFELSEDYTFYKSYKDENGNEIGVFPYDEAEVSQAVKSFYNAHFLIPPHEIRTYYEYYVIDEDWVGSGKLAYGEEGLMKQKMNETVSYNTRSFRVYLYPQNK